MSELRQITCAGVVVCCRERGGRRTWSHASRVRRRLDSSRRRIGPGESLSLSLAIAFGVESSRRSARRRPPTRHCPKEHQTVEQFADRNLFAGSTAALDPPDVIRPFGESDDFIKNFPGPGSGEPTDDQAVIILVVLAIGRRLGTWGSPQRTLPVRPSAMAHALLDERRAVERSPQVPSPGVWLLTSSGVGTPGRTMGLVPNALRVRTSTILVGRSPLGALGSESQPRPWRRRSRRLHRGEVRARALD